MFTSGPIDHLGVGRMPEKKKHSTREHMKRRLGLLPSRIF